MDRERDRCVNELAETQLGVVSIRQARDCGLSESALRHRLRQGQWERCASGVIRRSGSPLTEPQQAMVAVLSSGGVLSHGSAAALWNLPGFRLLPAHTTLGRSSGRHSGPRPQRHRTTYLPPHHITEVDGIPVLTPSRLLFQLAASQSAKRMASLTDKAWSRRLVSGRSLHEMCDELSEHGRDGMAVMREVLEIRPVGYVPPESNLEARVQDIIGDHDLPAMRRQVDLGGREWLGRVDFVAVDLPLIVFVDGERWHSSVLDRAADARQQADLEEAGFVVVRLPERDIWHDVPAVVAAVRRGWTLARRRGSRPDARTGA